MVSGVSAATGLATGSGSPPPKSFCQKDIAATPWLCTLQISQIPQARCKRIVRSSLWEHLAECIQVGIVYNPKQGGSAMLKAMLRKGVIVPLEPLPAEWE